MEETIIFEEASDLLKTLADPNRLRIFALLMEGDSCNCELKEKLDLPSNLLSHHLRLLRRAGLVKSRRDVIDGRWIYYAANRPVVEKWHEWFAAFLDPNRIQERQLLCGPEGQVAKTGASGAVLDKEW
jgi:ArsR family transcriptional regulator